MAGRLQAPVVILMRDDFRVSDTNHRRRSKIGAPEDARIHRTGHGTAPLTFSFRLNSPADPQFGGLGVVELEFCTCG